MYLKKIQTIYLDVNFPLNLIILVTIIYYFLIKNLSDFYTDFFKNFKIFWQTYVKQMHLLCFYYHLVLNNYENNLPKKCVKKCNFANNYVKRCIFNSNIWFSI